MKKRLMLHGCYLHTALWLPYRENRKQNGLEAPYQAWKHPESVTEKYSSE